MKTNTLEMLTGILIVTINDNCWLIIVSKFRCLDFVHTRVKHLLLYVLSIFGQHLTDNKHIRRCVKLSANIKVFVNKRTIVNTTM